MALRQNPNISGSILSISSMSVFALNEQEHAAVPEIVSGGQISRRRCQIRLFDKILNRKGARHVHERAAPLDIAITGFRRRRPDAECHHRAGASSRCRDIDSCLERLDIAHDVIGRHYQSQAFRIILQYL